MRRRLLQASSYVDSTRQSMRNAASSAEASMPSGVSMPAKAPLSSSMILISGKAVSSNCMALTSADDFKCMIS